MGMEKRGQSLVSMTNGDVYYINTETARDIQENLTIGRQTSVTFVDIKSLSTVTINMQNVSSVVRRDSNA